MLGAKECHTHNVLHRDFKLDNILLDRGLKCAKICDFGVSKIIKRNETIYDQCGTPAYLAPEIAAERGYENFTVDVWSLGICLFVILTGSVPFRAPTIPELYKMVLKGKFNVPEYLSSEAEDLLRRMLHVVPHSRIKVQQVLAHPWFKMTDEDKETIKWPEFLG